MKVYMLEMKYQKNYTQAYNIPFQNIDKKKYDKTIRISQLYDERNKWLKK
jgi:hypothetical protein